MRADKKSKENPRKFCTRYGFYSNYFFREGCGLKTERLVRFDNKPFAS